MQRLAQFMNEYSDRRIVVEGHTDATGGRQLNRRVEIVISDQGGQFPSGEQRSASAAD